jgi:DNA polymerase V
MSLSDQGEDLLYKLFGVNAELLIDHAWGWEPCTIADIKAYKPRSNSLSSGQVLSCPYEFEKAKLVTREMTDLLVLDLVEKKLVTDQVVLTVGYDVENLRDARRARHYRGAVTTDHYGRSVPKHAHGTQNLAGQTSSTAKIEQAVMELFDRVVDKNLLVRRINVTVTHVVSERDVPEEEPWVQLDIFTDYAAQEAQQKQEKAQLARERNRQEAILQIRKRFGKNAIVRGMSLEEGATAIQRNGQIGGHKA